jgi:hypothetical protein
MTSPPSGFHGKLGGVRGAALLRPLPLGGTGGLDRRQGASCTADSLLPERFVVSDVDFRRSRGQVFGVHPCPEERRSGSGPACLPTTRSPRTSPRFVGIPGLPLPRFSSGISVSPPQGWQERRTGVVNPQGSTSKSRRKCAKWVGSVATARPACVSSCSITKRQSLAPDRGHRAYRLAPCAIAALQRHAGKRFTQPSQCQTSGKAKRFLYAWRLWLGQRAIDVMRHGQSQ